MRVLLVTSNLSLRSGVMSVLMNYLRNINKNENTFSLIYYDTVDTPTYEEELLRLGIEVLYIGRKGFIGGLRDFCKPNYGRFDIIHINDPYISLCFIDIKARLGVRRVIFHAHSTKFSDSRIKGIRNYFLSLPSRNIADSLFACSSKAGNIIFGSKFKDKGHIVYNAIELEKFKFNLVSGLKVKEELGITGKTVIGHVGNMTPQKNHLFILDVFYEYFKKNSNTALLLVGDGFLKSKIQEKVKQLGIDNNVYYTGVVSNVADYMSAMDVFLFPSLFEGLGVVLIEAQTNGLRCVYSDVVPEEANLYPEDNINLSLKDDARVWADALFNIKNRRNCETEDNNYDIKQAANRLENLYKEILNE